MREKIRLDAVSGPLVGQSFPFEEPDVFVFGRAPDCHAHLPKEDLSASRHHFVMTIQPPRVTIRDLGSLNGTRVNGEEIGSRAPSETPQEGGRHEFVNVELRDGDEIQVGQTAFRLAVQQPVHCPQCGRPIEGVTVEEYVGWDDPRCETCRAQAAGAVPQRPPRPAPRVTTAGGDDPLAVLVRALAERRGLEPRRPGAPPRIPGYEIGRQIGVGGMGAVYLATRLEDGATVAVKVMLAEHEADEKARMLFEREIIVQKRLKGHPNCVRLLEADLEGFSSYFVMEFCPGGSADKLMERCGGRLPLATAAPLILQALDGLSFAHEHDIVHRDLKPPNVLLMSSDGGVAKLSDFGLAKNFEQAGLSGISGAGDIGGNPLGMPREQVLDYRFVGPVADVWGMGATFYNMLTGAFVRNFGPGRDPINVILSEEPVPIRQRDSSIPPRVAEVIDRALLDDPAERYQSAREFREALVEVV